MKANKTGIVILMFVFMAIVLMVAFGGKPYGPAPESSNAHMNNEPVKLRKPLSAASAAIVTSNAPPFADTNLGSNSDSTNAAKPSFAEDVAKLRPTDSQVSESNVSAIPDFQSPQFSHAGKTERDRFSEQNQSERQPRIVSPRESRLLGEIHPMDRQATSEQARPPVYNSPREQIRYHRVIDGDSLQSIAKRYLGGEQHYLAIFEANREILTRPDVLPLGSRLQIPDQRADQIGRSKFSPTTSQGLSGPFHSSPSELPPTGRPQPTTSPNPGFSPIPQSQNQQKRSAGDEWRSIRDAE